MPDTGFETPLIRLQNPVTGQWETWSGRDVLNYYRNSPVVSSRPATAGNGNPVVYQRTAPLNIDASWYMQNGPGSNITVWDIPITRYILENPDLVARGQSISVELYARNLEMSRGVSEFQLLAGLDNLSTWSTYSYVFGQSSVALAGTIHRGLDGRISIDARVVPFRDQFNIEPDKDPSSVAGTITNASNSRDPNRIPQREVPLDMIGEGRVIGTITPEDYTTYLNNQPAVTAFDAGPYTPIRCFLAGTPIAMADGTEKPIEQVVPGDLVLAFDPAAHFGRGALVGRRVTRLFRNITEDIVAVGGVHMTPGHHVLTGRGVFCTINEALAHGDALVRADGTLVRPPVQRYRLGDADAPDFEVATDLVMATEHGLALAPHARTGWRTYNFEVEGLHTYVAGGLRVHNRSALDFVPDEIINDPAAFWAVLGVDRNTGESRRVIYEDANRNLHVIDTDPGADGNSVLRTERVIISGGESAIEREYLVTHRSRVDLATGSESGKKR